MPPIGKLARIPLDVLHDGVDAISKFLANLPFDEGDRDDQTSAKLLVVGFAEVGKTTILRALFPEKTSVTHMGISKTLCLQGLRLTLEWNTLWGIWQLQGWLNPTIILEKGLLLSLQGNSMWIGDTNVTFCTERVAKRWHDMLHDIIETCTAETVNVDNGPKKPLPHRTHGIDVQTHYIDGVTVLAWDFAGQRSYLGNHRHFVSGQASFLHDQSVYMVVYDASKSWKDISIYLLDWLRTLKAHLPKAEELEEEVKQRTCIYVVGTHLDAEGVSDGAALRKRGDIIRECILESGIGYDWEHCEVSASTLDAVHFDHSMVNQTTFARSTPCAVSDIITTLGDRLVRVAGVRVLMSEQHAAVLDAVEDCEDPIIDLDDLICMVIICLIRLLICNLDMSSVQESILDHDEIRVALCRLSSWGRIIDIDGLDDVVVKPTFLTQHALGELFRPEHNAFFQNGEISVRDLKNIWLDSCADMEDSYGVMIAFLKGLHVCFASKSDANMLVFPDFLVDLPLSGPQVEQAWSAILGGIDLELAYGFDMDILPQEMIGVLAAMLSGEVSNLQPWKNVAIMHSKKNQATYGRIHAVQFNFRNKDRHRLLIHVRGLVSLLFSQGQ